MALVKIPLNTQYLSLYIEHDKGMVFHHIKQSLYQLPAVSIAFLLAIDEGLTEQRALNEVSTQSNLSEDQIISFYQTVKELFTTAKDELNYLDGRYPELNNVLDGDNHQPLPKATTYQVANSSFAISCQCSQLMSLIQDELSPCAKTLDNVDFQIEIDIQNHAQIETQIEAQSESQSETQVEPKGNNLFCIYSNDQLFAAKLKFDQVLPLIIDRLQILAFQKSDYYFCFHGAAIHTTKGTLLLPGKSGAGKSTLSAALANLKTNETPNQLYSDEIIAFDQHFNLITLTLPIAVKSGSWQVLEQHYPELNNVHVWHRQDGRLLKYVWPKHFAVPPEPLEPSEPSHQLASIEQQNANKFVLVNPNYQNAPQAPNNHKALINQNRLNKFAERASINPNAQAETLSVIDTIAMLTDGGYQLGVELTEEKLDLLISFITKIKCCKLSYDSTETALSLLESLWPKQ